MSIKINETPVRTSRNFRINNIKLDIDIPNNVNNFENIEVKGTAELQIDELNNQEKLVYGNGEILESNVYKNANHKIKIIAKEDVKIVYEFDNDNLELINQIEIVGEKNANIIIEYKSNTNKKCFHNGIIRTTAKENSKLNIVIVN